MPVEREEQEREEERTIESKTFDQWRKEYETVATPYTAREMAACLFGYPLGPQLVEAPEDESEPEREG